MLIEKAMDKTFYLPLGAQEVLTGRAAGGSKEELVLVGFLVEGGFLVGAGNGLSTDGREVESRESSVGKNHCAQKPQWLGARGEGPTLLWWLWWPDSGE